jgi:hypothetical protein
MDQRDKYLEPGELRGDIHFGSLFLADCYVGT